MFQHRVQEIKRRLIVEESEGKTCKNMSLKRSIGRLRLHSTFYRNTGMVEVFYLLHLNSRESNFSRPVKELDICSLQ